MPHLPPQARWQVEWVSLLTLQSLCHPLIPEVIVKLQQNALELVMFYCTTVYKDKQQSLDMEESYVFIFLSPFKMYLFELLLNYKLRSCHNF